MSDDYGHNHYQGPDPSTVGGLTPRVRAKWALLFATARTALTFVPYLWFLFPDWSLAVALVPSREDGSTLILQITVGALVTFAGTFLFFYFVLLGLLPAWGERVYERRKAAGRR